jgi:hypothetical protein
MEIQRMNKCEHLLTFFSKNLRIAGVVECRVSTAVSISKGNSGNKSNLIS